MTTDIVERLRAYPPMASDDGSVISYASVFTEAADEIALTRTTLANAVELNKAKTDEIEKLRAQVVSLQSSLDVGAKEKK